MHQVQISIANGFLQDFLVNMSASADVLAMAKVEVDLNQIPLGKNVCDYAFSNGFEI